MRRTTRLLPVMVAGALLLAGCVAPAPLPEPPPTTAAEPVFASDEEALAAAEEAYGAFLSTLDQILADGGSDPDRLLTVASGEVLEQELVGFESMQAQGLVGVGRATAVLSLQSFNEFGEVVAYACDDIGETNVLNAAGESVVDGSGSTKYAYEVSFSGQPLIVESRLPWEGGGVCD